MLIRSSVEYCWKSNLQVLVEVTPSSVSHNKRVTRGSKAAAHGYLLARSITELFAGAK